MVVINSDKMGLIFSCPRSPTSFANHFSFPSQSKCLQYIYYEHEYWGTFSGQRKNLLYGSYDETSQEF